VAPLIFVEHLFLICTVYILLGLSRAFCFFLESCHQIFLWCLFYLAISVSSIMQWLTQSTLSVCLNCQNRFNIWLLIISLSFQSQFRSSEFRSKLKTHLFRQAYNTAWLLWEQFRWRVNSVTVTIAVRAYICSHCEWALFVFSRWSCKVFFGKW